MFAALPPSPPAAVSVAAATATAVTAETHRVRSGDTLSGLAVRYAVSQGELRRANGLRGDTIRVGERLRIPRASGKTPSTTTASVARGTAGTGSGHASRARTRDAIAAAARRHGVDPALALAVGWQESRWRQNSLSHAGAVGAMQCLPSTGEWMSGKAGRTLDLRTVEDNATCGVLLLKTLSRQSGDEAEVIGAYYQGMASVKERGPYDDTRAYVSSVKKHRDRIAAGKAPQG